MSAEFNWWLLIVGLVAGGALTWLVLADSNRREQEISDEELSAEAAWIARTLSEPVTDADLVERVLRAHRRYLGFPPPDALVDPEALVALDGPGAADAQGALDGPGPVEAPATTAMPAPGSEPGDDPMEPASRS